MFVRPDIPLHLDDAHASHVYVPAIDVVTLGLRVQHAGVDGVPIHDLELGEANPLLETGRSGDARDHHKLHELLGLPRQLPTLSLLKAVLGGRDILAREGLQEDLQLVLPELLLASLVKERELAHMVDEDEAEDGQLRVVGGHLAEVGFERGAEAAKGSR